MDILEDTLISYGTSLLARQLGRGEPEGSPSGSPLSGDTSSSERVERARQLLGDWSGSTPPSDPGRLHSIFSFIRHPNERSRRVEAFVPRRVLSTRLDQDADQAVTGLWQGFRERLERLPPGWGRFESFASLLARYGWNVPGTLEAEGVSVFQQFKMVTALAHVLGTEHEEVLLVAGDLPGIQEVLYTITSKGAAKSLRGRSFYLQLLNDAIVRAVLRDLRLPSPCTRTSATLSRCCGSSTLLR